MFIVLYLGTAGFSYKDWKGVFYPDEMKPGDFLEYYSRFYNCVEIDYTYYRQPVPKTMEAMTKKVPPSFRFTVKAHKTLTHEIPSGSALDKEVQTFIEGVMPMAGSGTLGCVLFQFPWSFRYSSRNLDYVTGLSTMVPVAPAVVEFRNREWARDDVYRALRDAGEAFCCVDEPKLRSLFPGVVRVTANPGYLRFHGRNAAKWFDHKEAWERYDYLYSDEELKEWIPKIRQMQKDSPDTYVLFNNCHRGQAALNASRLQELLLLDDPQEKGEIDAD